jgi:hypothetical protein
MKSKQTSEIISNKEIVKGIYEIQTKVTKGGKYIKCKELYTKKKIKGEYFYIQLGVKV